MPAVAEPVPTRSLVNILPIVPGTTLLVVTLAVTSSGVTVGVVVVALLLPTVITVVLLTQLVGVAVVQIL